MTNPSRRLHGLLAAASGAALLLAPVGCRSATRSTAQARAASDQTPEIASAINAWHQAAAESDFDAYFGLMTEDAVFLGTDATERWDRAQFEAFSKPYFDVGRGWVYQPIERKIMIGAGGRTAWFDERLMNAGLGECRGTGVVERGPGGDWRLAHYSLTIPIPNAIAREVADQIKAMETTADTPPTETAEAQTP